jgi:hypothetical protein
VMVTVFGEELAQLSVGDGAGLAEELALTHRKSRVEGFVASYENARVRRAFG